LNIHECIDSLSLSAEAIGGAPEKGFIDLDAVRDSIQKACLYLDRISSQFELGIKLKEDAMASLKAKINALKIAGYAHLLIPPDEALDSENLNFEQYKSFRAEIDQALAKCFGTLKTPGEKHHPTNLNDYH
jgi:hypothetical protein